jgi:hypothetical protein
MGHGRAPQREVGLPVDLVSPFFGVLGWVSFALLIFKLFVLVDAAIRPAPLYVAAGKQTKPFWLIILGLAALATLLSQGPVAFMGFLNIAGLIAAIVYMVDVRPALRGLGKGGRGGGDDKRHMGPYGPW